MTNMKDGIFIVSDKEPTTQYLVDAQRTDSYTETGSAFFPFKTIASAVAHAIADSRNDSNPAFMGIAGKLTETVSLTHGGHFFTGLNSSGTHAPIVCTGSWTFAGEDGSITANHFAVQSMSITGPSTGNAIHFTGAQAQRLFLDDFWITAVGNGAIGLLADNTAGTSVVEIDGLHLAHTGTTGENYCIDVGTGNTVTISDMETSSSSAQVAIVRAGGVLNIGGASEIDAVGVEAIHVLAGGVLTVTESQITNTQANSSGIMLDASAVCVLGNVNIDVPTGTGYAINGPATGTAYCYYYGLTFGINPATGLPKNTGIHPNVLMIKMPEYSPSYVAGVEYTSPNQHGGIYGTIYRMYFNTTLPSSLTVISKLVYSMLHFTRDSTGARFSAQTWSDAGTGTDYIRIGHTPGAGLFINVSGCTLISGWVDYTK